MDLVQARGHRHWVAVAAGSPRPMVWPDPPGWFMTGGLPRAPGATVIRRRRCPARCSTRDGEAGPAWRHSPGRDRRPLLGGLRRDPLEVGPPYPICPSGVAQALVGSRVGPFGPGQVASSSLAGPVGADEASRSERACRLVSPIRPGLVQQGQPGMVGPSGQELRRKEFGMGVCPCCVPPAREACIVVPGRVRPLRSFVQPGHARAVLPSRKPAWV